MKFLTERELVLLRYKGTNLYVNLLSGDVYPGSITIAHDFGSPGAAVKHPIKAEVRELLEIIFVLVSYTEVEPY